MTPSQVIDELKKGNERFRAGKMAPRDYLAEKRSSASGQYPAAIMLGALTRGCLPKSFSTLASVTCSVGAWPGMWSTMTSLGAWSSHVPFQEQNWS